MRLAPAWRGAMLATSLLVGMEASGIVRDAFRAQGVDAWSCDTRECEGDPAYHFHGNVFELIRWGWPMAIFHPDCTYLTSSGLHWNKINHGREACTLYALDTVKRLMAAPIPMMAIENPRGRIGTAIRKADQVLQPHQFGEDAAKETRLWLKGLPKLRPTGNRRGRIVTVDSQNLFGDGVERWSNQTDAGQNRVPGGRNQWIERSRTYPGVANAMALQWGEWLRAMGGPTSAASLIDAPLPMIGGGSRDSAPTLIPTQSLFDRLHDP